MSMTPDACQFSMSLLLRQETDLTRQLLELLDREFAAITNRDFPAFEQLINEKSMCIEQLDLLEQERIALTESAGYKPGPDGMLYFLQWCDPQKNISPRWDGLLGLAGQCRDRNRRNHQLVEMCSQNTRDVLRILRGEEPGATTYQADGDTRDDFDRKAIARA